MPKEAFEGEWLRKTAEQSGLQIEGLTDQEIRQECYKAIKNSDIVEAFEYKHGCSWEQWDREQWDETLNTVEVKQALTDPLMRRKYSERVGTAVRDVFPAFEDCYDPSFAQCLTMITDGKEDRMRSALEQLAAFHTDHSKAELSCGGLGYSGKMLHALYQNSIINI